MTYGSKVRENIQEAFIKRIADDIIQGIEKVYEKKEISSRRWIWELLQNAKDVPNVFNRVKIRIVLDKEYLMFSHNGDPFTVKNLTNLIMQVSSKSEDEEDDVTGKFGTGFLVTHLLSKSLKVEGILHERDEKPLRFKIDIERNTDDTRELIALITNTLDKIENLEANPGFIIEPDYLSTRTEDCYDTVFYYPLNLTKSIEWAQKGFDELINTLPMTLIFVDKIKEVHLENRITGTKTNFTLISKLLSLGKINTVLISNTSSIYTEQHEYFWTVTTEEDKLTCAIKVKSTEDLSPIPWRKNTPKLYRDFPLIGSEKIYLPAVINGGEFYPNELRSGLLISDDDSTKVRKNRDLLVKAMEIIMSMVTHITTSTQTGLFLLANSKTPEDFPRAWYIENIQKPYRNFLLETNIVHNGIGLEKLRNCKFPKFSDEPETNEEFFNIVAPYIGHNKLPLKQELNEWLRFISSDYENWNLDLRYTPDDFIKSIDRKTITDIEITGTDFTVTEWLNRIYQFLEEKKKRSLISEYHLVPNTYGTFCKINTLYINDSIHIELLEILSLLEQDLNPTLIHKDILLPFEGHQKINNKEVSNNINEIIKGLEFNNDEYSIQVIYSILRVYPNDKESFRSILFKCFCEFFNRANEIIIIENINDEFDFNPITRHALDLLLCGIADLNSINGLMSHLNVDKQEAISWISGLLLAIDSANSFREFLKRYKVIPNMREEFCNMDCLYNNGTEDESLPDELLIILHDFDINQDWKDVLVSDGIGLRVSQTRKIEELSNLIEDRAKLVFSDMTNKTDVSDDHIKVLMKLVKWTTNNHNLAIRYFKWTIEKKPLINTLRIEDPMIKDAMYELIEGETNKIPLLVEVARKFNLDQLNNISQLSQNIDFEKVISLGSLAGVLSNSQIHQLYELIDKLGSYTLIGIANEELQRNLDFQFKKRIGSLVESAFLACLSDLMPSVEVKQSDGPYDFIIRNAVNNKCYYLELKSISRNRRYILMAQSQAEFSVSHQENYALCVIRRDHTVDNEIESQVDTSYLLNNLRTVPDIGSLLINAVYNAMTFRDEYINGNGHEIGIEFYDSNYHYRVPDSIYSNGQSMMNLIQTIYSKIL